MKVIKVNGISVKLADETFARIEKTAQEKNITTSQEISFLLEKVI